jgi:XRE family transcriptional regulator, fatty acid utilization regulator
MTWRTLGAQIQRLRTERELTQEQLAAAAGLSRIYIQKIELGERMPAFPALERIAKAMGTTLHVSLEPNARARTRRT